MARLQHPETTTVAARGIAAPTDVVVGYDGTVEGDAALDWAAEETGRRSARLRLVCVNAYSHVTWPGIGTSAEFVRDLAERGRARAASVLPAGRVTAAVMSGGITSSLVEATRTADLLVLGHHCRGRLDELLIGSVVSAVAAHSRCDVAVIPHGRLVTPGPGAPVVVGVDGSPEGDVAAHRAAEYAERYGAPLKIVQAWRTSNVVAWPEGLVAGVDVLIDASGGMERSAEASVRRVAATLRGAYPTLTIATHVVEEHAVPALRDAAASAGLLVVGTRGLGALERFLLGSTSRGVLNHAAGPVIVARPRPRVSA